MTETRQVTKNPQRECITLDRTHCGRRARSIAPNVLSCFENTTLSQPPEEVRMRLHLVVIGAILIATPGIGNVAQMSGEEFSSIQQAYDQSTIASQLTVGSK